LKPIKTISPDEMQKFEDKLKKHNWILMLITVITIPFIVSNM